MSGTPIQLEQVTFKPASPGASAPPGITRPAALVKEPWLEFASFLARTQALTGDFLSKVAPANKYRRAKRLRDLWDLTDLSASDFADAVAGFFKLPRVQPSQLLAATPLCAKFSLRFLREMTVFPCQTELGANRLVLADPTDSAAIRAAEMVLAGPVTVEVASFEDIETVLSKQLGAQDTGSLEDAPAMAERDDDIESLRDLASGAPVVRAVNDLLEKALE